MISCRFSLGEKILFFMIHFPCFLILIFFINEYHCFRKDPIFIDIMDEEGGPCQLRPIRFFKLVSEGYLQI